jgi:hypothetical protein
VKAVIEVLSGIVRVGPEMDHYGSPYDIAVAFSSTDGKTVVLKALVSDQKLRFSHYKAILKALKELDLKPTWVRIQRNS